MTSPTTTTTTTTVNNQLNALVNETPDQNYMRQFVDYLDNGMDFPELSQIRQLDIYLQDYYRRIRELIENSHNEQSQLQSNSQTMLMNILIQIKIIGDKKMQLSQQMLDATEQQSKKLKIAHQKYVESINQQNSISDNNTNEIDSDNEYDFESGSQRSLTTKSLWKRKAPNSTMNSSIKRKCIINSEQNDKSNNNERDRKKSIQRNLNLNIPNNNNNNNNNGRKLRLNNDLSTTQSDETTYCLCSQLSYGSMILCDNKSCEIKWFHFNCVNLTTKPKGKWFCPHCRENRI